MKKLGVLMVLLGLVFVFCSDGYAEPNTVVTVWAFSGVKDENGTFLDQMMLEVEIGRQFFQGYGVVYVAPSEPSGTVVVSGAGYPVEGDGLVFTLQMAQHLLTIIPFVTVSNTGSVLFGDAFLYSPTGRLISKGTVLLLEVR